MCVSCLVMSDSVIPWTVAPQALLAMDYSKQEYWSGLPFSSPGDFPNPGIEPGPPVLQADALYSEPSGKPQLKGWRLFNMQVGDSVTGRRNHPFPR